jgi:hypothetical protein
VESSFPHSIIQRMPSCTNNALSAIKSKSLCCTFCAETLLDCIGRMATKYSYSQLLQLHDSEESFVTECVELVYCGYIYKALQSLENDASRAMSRDKYYLILKKCKEDSKIKRMKRRHDEVYLGKNRFANELHSSFNEFMVNVVATLGFCPLKVG